MQQKTRIAPQAQSFSLQRRIPIWILVFFWFVCFFLPRSPTGVCCRGTSGVLSSRRSASLFQRAGSSSQPSGPWPHTSPSCWPSGRSHTGGGGCEVRPPAPHQRYRSVKSLSANPQTTWLLWVQSHISRGETLNKLVCFQIVLLLLRDVTSNLSV